MAGEEWLVKKIGAYLPGAYEEVVDVVNAYVLTEKVRTTQQGSNYCLFQSSERDWALVYPLFKLHHIKK